MGTPAAEVDVDADLVRRLLADQHPDLAERPLVELASGWDNVLFRLGDDLLVRLPRREASAHLVEHEQRWLPALAPLLPLPVPVPIRTGRSGQGYPWRWSIVPWIPGAPIHERPPADWTLAAERLGTFVAALHQPAPPDAPRNPFRGTPLVDRTERLHSGLAEAAGQIDEQAVLGLWPRLVELPSATDPPLWLHGDLHPLNIVVHHGEVAGILDFGDLAAGDRATDLSLAWLVLPPDARPAFRAAAGARRPIDDATWSRARAWAIALGVAYQHGDAVVSAIGARAVAEALADSS